MITAAAQGAAEHVPSASAVPHATQLDAEELDNRSSRQLPMYRLTVVYDEPADKEAFELRYTDEHVPLVKASPGLASFQLSHPQGGTPYLVAELFWHSEDAFKAWAARPRAPRSATTHRAVARRSRPTPATSLKSDPTAPVRSRTRDALITRRRGLQQGLISGSSVVELDFDDRAAINAARLAGNGEIPRHADRSARSG